MYISEATRDALCAAGIQSICLLIGGMCLAVSMPWIIRKLKIASLHVLVICERICVWAVYLKKASLAARAKRRERIAEKIFERPVRWDRNVLQK